MYVAPDSRRPGLKARSKALAQVHAEVKAAKERSERAAAARQVAGK